MAVVYCSTACMKTMMAGTGLCLCHISCCGVFPVCVFVHGVDALHAHLLNVIPKPYSISALAASAYLYWQARARPPHPDKLPLCIIDDDSLKVSGKDGGSSGLGSICRRPFSRDVSGPGLPTHPCSHQLSLLSTCFWVSCRLLTLAHSQPLATAHIFRGFAMTAASCILTLGGRESKACSTPLNTGSKELQLSNGEVQLSGSDSLSRPNSGSPEPAQITDRHNMFSLEHTACLLLIMQVA